MNPLEAVRNVLSHPVRFTGRASRSEFWWFALFEFFIASLAAVIDIPLHSPVLVVVVGIVLLLPAISVSMRRLHDTDRCGWWVLIEIVPFIGIFWLLALCARPGNTGYNRYGPSPTQQVPVGDRP